MSTIEEQISLMKAQDGASEEELLRKAKERNQKIVKTSLIGVVVNVLLAAFKAVIGMVSGSIAITLDAVNNISDAGSSVITVIGTKLAARPANKKHPFGYGRIEYLSAMIISLIVLYAGVTSLQESVKKIIHPEAADYTMVALTIVAVAVLVKILLGRYVENAGRKTNSDSLINSGKDATLDSVISASTLVAAVIYLTTGVSLESWLGAIISVVIIKSGIEMLLETLSEILGERADPAMAQEIKKTVKAFPGVQGVYDLVLNNYGPDTYNGSLHIEVMDTQTADEIDALTRAITYEVYRKHGVILTAVSVYSQNTKDPEAVEMRKQAAKAVRDIPYILQMHGFYLDKEKKGIRMDLVVSFDSPNREETFREAKQALESAFPGYRIYAVMDTDFSEV